MPASRTSDAPSPAATDADAAERRAARGAWPIRRYRLGDEPGDDLSARTSPDARLAMMWPLAVDAWSTAGHPLPEYTRDRMPVRVIRRRTASETG